MYAGAGRLQIRGLTLTFGGVAALDGVSFDVPAGELCALIGPNGAGKTSVVNCLTRIYQPSAGTISLDDADVLAVPAHGIAALGIARTFQELALLPRLTVAENVLLATHSATRAGWVAGALALPFARREQQGARTHVAEILRLMALTEVGARPVAQLPFATLKRVELARALAAKPRLLVLDEPASGLSGAELEAFVDVIARVRSIHPVTVLLIEHHMGMVMKISDRVVVLAAGRVIAQGSPQQVSADPRVIETYLGSPA